jgi:hypothetical protein
VRVCLFWRVREKVTKVDAAQLFDDILTQGHAIVAAMAYAPADIVSIYWLKAKRRVET